MPRRRGRPCKKSNIEKDANQEEYHGEKEDIVKPQVEHQISAVRAIRDVETEHLLTSLHLLRSMVGNELQVPLKQYFEEKLPRLAIVRTEKPDQYEVQWRDDDGNLSMEQFDEGSLHASLLHELSKAYPDYSSARPSFGGFEFSNRSVKTAVPGAENLQIKRFVLEEQSDTRIFDVPDTLQTPSASSSRWSVGTAPKTVRLPKPGEMLLSVHGSPLGVFKEDNMEAIQESEDG